MGKTYEYIWVTDEVAFIKVWVFGELEIFKLSSEEINEMEAHYTEVGIQTNRLLKSIVDKNTH